MTTAEMLAAIDLRGVAISAELKADGTLGAVGGAYAKVLAAAEEVGFPRVHTVVFAEEQREQIARERPALLGGDTTTDLRILFARSFAHLAEQLAADGDDRWRDLIDTSSESSRHAEVVGREWHRERVRAFVESPGGGYLLFVAGPGYGKSALAAELARTLPDVVAHHFIKRGMGGWDDPKLFLRSLAAQVRRGFALAGVESEERMAPEGVLASRLVRAGRLLDGGRRAVAVIDGLDEAFGPEGRFAGVALPGLLPDRPPDGIKVILTSRPGEHLSWLADNSLCETVPLDPGDDTQHEAIRDYLRLRSARDGLGLDETTLSRLADAAQGCFAAAVLYLRDRPGRDDDLRRWAADPSSIPLGLDGWLEAEWSRLTRPLHLPSPWRDDPARLEETVRATLGLMATAREPLSIDMIEAFLSPLRRAGEGGHGEPARIGSVDAATILRHLREVARLASGFFDHASPVTTPADRRRFFHTRFPEFVLARKLSSAERRDAETLLARACSRWDRLDSPARDYALRHRVGHAVAVARWKSVAAAFADAPFVIAKSRLLGFPSVHADASLAARHPSAPSAWSGRLIPFERFLRFRIERLRNHVGSYAREVRDEFVSTDDALRVLFRKLEDERPVLSKIFGPPALRDRTGHFGPVRAVALSSNGRLVASGGEDGVVRVSMVATGEAVAECPPHERGVSAVAFSPDGRLLASGDYEGTVRVSLAATGEAVAECPTHGAAVYALAFSPDGRLVASGDGDGAVRVSLAATGEAVAECRTQGASVYALAFSPDGRLVVSGDYEGTVRVSLAATGEAVAEYPTHGDWVHALAFSPDGRLVASGGGGAVRVNLAATGEAVAECPPHEDLVFALAFSPDGRLVASGNEGAVRVSMATGEAVAEYPTLGVVFPAVAFSPDGQLIARGGYDGAVRVSMATGEAVAECRPHGDPVRAVIFSPGGRLVASGGGDGDVRMSLATGEAVADRQPREGGGRVLAFSPDGRLVATGGDGAVRVSLTATGEAVAECPPQGDYVRAVAFSPDGQLLASGGGDRTVRVFRIATADRAFEAATTLFFDVAIQAIGFAGETLEQLIVVDATGRIFGYCMNP